ncbi:MAG: anaerobic ribonucleoside-triphosphate reductase activating protein [Clostridia bacterium]|nr:anaerobic ribonucleoside-triphosphate reductase activating protein [Clostridia bacterium]
MKIGGFLKQSFVDFPATISAVIFTSGCNINCWYCHNRELIDGTKEEDVSLEYIYDFLEKRKGFLDGVVISGGEPTLQKDLLDVIKHLKSMGFKVKLDTNGTNPDMLEKVLPFIDFVAMDIKTCPENYQKIVGKVDIENIKKSVKIIMSSDKDYEFRTTFAPGISFEDIEQMADFVRGAKRFALQTYRPQGEHWPKQPPENYEKALNIIKKYIFNAFIR